MSGYDIVTELRESTKETFTSDLLEKAAAEIEHLRSTVTILRRMCGPVSIERPFTEIRQELKEKHNVPSS